MQPAGEQPAGEPRPRDPWHQLATAEDCPVCGLAILDGWELCEWCGTCLTGEGAPGHQAPSPARGAPEPAPAGRRTAEPAQPTYLLGVQQLPPAPVAAAPLAPVVVPVVPTAPSAPVPISKTMVEEAIQGLVTPLPGPVGTGLRAYESTPVVVVTVQPTRTGVEPVAPTKPVEVSAPALPASEAAPPGPPVTGPVQPVVPTVTPAAPVLVPTVVPPAVVPVPGATMVPVVPVVPAAVVPVSVVGPVPATAAPVPGGQLIPMPARVALLSAYEANSPIRPARPVIQLVGLNQEILPQEGSVTVPVQPTSVGPLPGNVFVRMPLPTPGTANAVPPGTPIQAPIMPILQTMPSQVSSPHPLPTAAAPLGTPGRVQIPAPTAGSPILTVPMPVQGPQTPSAGPGPRAPEVGPVPAGPQAAAGPQKPNPISIRLPVWPTGGVSGRIGGPGGV